MALLALLMLVTALLVVLLITLLVVLARTPTPLYRSRARTRLDLKKIRRQIEEPEL